MGCWSWREEKGGFCWGRVRKDACAAAAAAAAAAAMICLMKEVCVESWTVTRPHTSTHHESTRTHTRLIHDSCVRGGPCREPCKLPHLVRQKRYNGATAASCWRMQQRFGLELRPPLAFFENSG
jgi:hypothetical protein